MKRQIGNWQGVGERLSEPVSRAAYSAGQHNLSQQSKQGTIIPLLDFLMFTDSRESVQLSL